MSREERLVELLATRLLPHICAESVIDRDEHARAIARTLILKLAHSDREVARWLS